MDRQAEKRSQLVGWNDRPMYRWKEGISGFGQTDGQADGQTDRQTESIMSLVPKGGGIKKRHQQTHQIIITTIIIIRVNRFNGDFSQNPASRHNSNNWFHFLTAHVLSLDLNSWAPGRCGCNLEDVNVKTFRIYIY